MVENFNELTIESEVFEDARSKFNGVLQRLFHSMLDAKSDEGSITMKIDVEMITQMIPNTNDKLGEDFREIHVPNFEYKVSSQVALKNEQKGIKNPEMEVVYDPETKMYVLKYVADTEQRSIFDEDFMEQAEDQYQEQPGEVLGLPDNIVGLPDNGGEAVEEPEEIDYDNWTAADLYELCVKRGIKAAKKKGAEYYIKKLREADKEA